MKENKKERKYEPEYSNDYVELLFRLEGHEIHIKKDKWEKHTLVAWNKSLTCRIFTIKSTVGGYYWAEVGILTFADVPANREAFIAEFEELIQH